MIRARSRLYSLRGFVLGLSAGVALVSGCVRTSNKDGAGGCMSSTECATGSECTAGECQPIGTGGSVSTGGASTDGGSNVVTGGSTTTDTGGNGTGTGGGSAGGNESGGSSSGGGSSGGSSGGSEAGGSSSGGTSLGGAGGGMSGTGGGAATVELIDDLEDGDGRILANSGRQGPWHVFNSSDTGAGKAITPEMGGHSGQYAMHTSGMGYTFAGLGLGLNNPDAPESAQSKAYDASAWTGVAFWVKAGSTAGASLRVEAPMRDFVPTERGGTCTDGCWNVYGAAVTTPLTTTWQEVRIPFSSMMRESGTTPAFDAKQILTISFKHTGNNDPFDFWIDDVGFYK